MLEYIHPDVEWRPALGPGGREGRAYRVCASGAEVRVPFGQMAQFRDGLVVRLDAFPDHTSARAAAGIGE